jgi:hypothetical protein
MMCTKWINIGMNGRCVCGHIFQPENSWTNFDSTFKGILLLEAAPNSYFVITYSQ